MNKKILSITYVKHSVKALNKLNQDYLGLLNMCFGVDEKGFRREDSFTIVVIGCGQFPVYESIRYRFPNALIIAFDSNREELEKICFDPSSDPKLKLFVAEVNLLKSVPSDVDDYKKSVKVVIQNHPPQQSHSDFKSALSFMLPFVNCANELVKPGGKILFTYPRQSDYIEYRGVFKLVVSSNRNSLKLDGENTIASSKHPFYDALNEGLQFLKEKRDILLNNRETPQFFEAFEMKQKEHAILEYLLNPVLNFKRTSFTEKEPDFLEMVRDVFWAMTPSSIYDVFHEELDHSSNLPSFELENKQEILNVIDYQCRFAEETLRSINYTMHQYFTLIERRS